MPSTRVAVPTAMSVSPGSIRPPAMVKTERLPSSVMTSFRSTRSAIAPVGWSQLPGGAIVAATSPDGSVWVLSSLGSGPDRSIWHYANGTWTNVPGAAMRIAVGPDGTPWVVNSAGSIYSFDGTTWNGIAGGASDISVGADGSVYVISNQGGNPYGRGIWRFAGGAWTQMPGAAVRVAASWDTGSYTGGLSPGGIWVVNAGNSIFYYSPSTGFVQVPGAAIEVAPTIIGGIFALGYLQNADGSYPIYYYDLSSTTWTVQPGAAVSLSSNSASTVYAIGVAGGIYKGSVSTGGFGGGASLPAPPWWNDSAGVSHLCDSFHNSNSKPLPDPGAVYLGVRACGPLPLDKIQKDLSVTFTGFGNSPNQALEWECVELSMRFMYIAYRIPVYGADGFDIATNYRGPVLAKIPNNGMGPLPVPGDIIQYGDGNSVSSTKVPNCDVVVPKCNYGHTSVVTGASIPSIGKGTIYVMEQNNSSTGVNMLSVENGVVTGRPYGITAWLHQAGTNTIVGPNPTPLVSSLSPTSMTANGQAQTLVISGNSFAAGDVVQFKWGQGLGANTWNPSNAMPTVNNPNQIAVSMNPGNVSDVIDVRVCSNGAATACSDGLVNVVVSAPSSGVPTVSSVSPSSVNANGQAQVLTINGNSFAAGDVVEFEWGQGLGAGSWHLSNATPNVVNASQITVSMNPGTVSDTIFVRICTDSTSTSCSDGSKNVVVTTSGGGGSPTVSSVSPTQMFANGQQQTLTINGSSFAAGDIVQFKWGQGAGANVWNTSNATPQINSPNQISVGLNPGTVSDNINVRVCSSSAATNCSDGAASVLVIPPDFLPTVSSISPTSMLANGQTQTLTIYGSSFASGDIVQYKFTQGAGANSWNTSNATPSVLSSGQISVGLNPGTVSDTFQVRVCSSSAATNCSDGNATVSVSPAAVTPSVSSLSPTSMTANGQTQTLTIFGSSFASGDIVQYKYTQGAGANSWNTSNATPSVLSSGQISVGLNPGTVTDTFQVRVCSNSAATNCSDGNATVSVSPVVATPSVSSLSPTSMTANGQTQTLTIFGNSFASGDIVQFKYTQGAGANAWHTSNATPSVLSSGQISVGLNPGAVSDTFQVRVCSSSAATNCSDGNATVTVSPAVVTPSVSSLSPTSMTANGQTQTLTIFGNSFASGDIVQFKYTQGAGANAWHTSNATPSVLSSGQISVGLNPGTVSDTFQVRVCSSSAATNCSDGNATVSVH